MKELFQNTYIDNGYLIQNQEDFKYAPKYNDTIWSYNKENSYVQLPEKMFYKVQDYDSITIPSYILYNDVYYQVYLPDDCSRLFWDCAAENIDLHYIINTSNVINMNEMFACCYSLTELDLSNFDTSNVIYMAGMFSECRSLQRLNLSSFDTSNVTDMQYMFHDCINLTSLDLSNFNTSKVTNMLNMFGECINLTELDLSNFDTSSVTDMRYMFDDCPVGELYKDDERFVGAFSEETLDFASFISNRSDIE